MRNNTRIKLHFLERDLWENIAEEKEFREVCKIFDLRPTTRDNIISKHFTEPQLQQINKIKKVLAP